MAMTDRAGRWATEQVGRCARSVAEVARELGCDWHTVNDAVLRYGEALVDEPGRFGAVSALGLDEVLFVRRGPFHTKEFATSIADVRAGQLLDVVPGRRAKGPAQWLYDQGLEFCTGVEWATLDLSGPYRSSSTPWCPGRSRWPTPFMSSSTPTPSSTKSAAGSRTRRLGTGAARATRSIGSGACSPRLTSVSRSQGANGSSASSAPAIHAGEVAAAWHAKEAVRELYAHADEATAREWIERLIADMADRDQTLEVRSLGRTLGALEGTDRGLAPLSRFERPHRSRQQPDQARQACRLRVHLVSKLPSASTALRRQARLVTPRDDRASLRGPKTPSRVESAHSLRRSVR